MLKSWTKPFREVFAAQERVEIVHLHLNEGWFNTNILKPLISKTVKNNTPEQEYDSTLICFRKDLEDFRDALRMHNILSGYVFLIDGIGRVRFAGSGEATPEDIERIIGFAKELTPLRNSNDKSGGRKSKKKQQRQ
jgi:ATPase complex subunit ATP10